MKPIEITTGINGYPSHVHRGYVGFGSFEEAESFAMKYNGTVVSLQRRDGWQFYKSNGWAGDAFELTEDTFGNDYRTIDSVEQWEDECREVLSLMIEEKAQLEEIVEETKGMTEVRERIENLHEGETVLLYQGKYHSVIETRCMSFREDVWEHIIGVEIDGYNDEADRECD